MKVLFLDIDGVLNSLRSAIAFDGLHGIERLDPTAVKLIKNLCDEHDVKIVLSSTWRYSMRWHPLRDDFELPIIDVTSRDYDKKRGDEIQEWLDKNNPEVYAIVDDYNNMLEHQQPFFVQTDNLEGLSYQNYKELRRILTGIDKQDLIFF